MIANTERQIQKLLAIFSSAAKKHYDAQLACDPKTANKQVKKFYGAFLELIKFGEEGRQALLTLTDVDDLAVAAMAATYSLKYDTKKALSVLEKIAKEPGFIGFAAQQAIKRWNEGTWKLE